MRLKSFHFSLNEILDPYGGGGEVSIRPHAARLMNNVFISFHNQLLTVISSDPPTVSY